MYSNPWLKKPYRPNRKLSSCSRGVCNQSEPQRGVTDRPSEQSEWGGRGLCARVQGLERDAAAF